METPLYDKNVNALITYLRTYIGKSQTWVLFGFIMQTSPHTGYRVRVRARDIVRDRGLGLEAERSTDGWRWDCKAKVSHHTIKHQTTTDHR